jgi:elongation factor G
MQNKLKHNAGFIQIPIGLQKECEGVIDLIKNQAMYFDGPYGETIRLDEIPKHMRDEAADRRHMLIEQLSNSDEKFGNSHIFDAR